MSPPQMMFLISVALGFIGAVAAAIWGHVGYGAYGEGTVTRMLQSLGQYPFWLALTFLLIGMLVGGLMIHCYEPRGWD